MSGFDFTENEAIRKLVAITIIILFVMVNLWSVKGMGKLEDIMVYVKLTILFIISIVLIYFGKVDFHTFTTMMTHDIKTTPVMSILIVASVTFVAYEGFQLVINAVNEMDNPDKNIPRAIYSAIVLVALIYFLIELSAVLVIPTEDLIRNKESALASGAQNVMGDLGRYLVIFGAVLATSSAINGTLFGSSRQMARISEDGYLPHIISLKTNHIPKIAIITMAMVSSLLIAVGGLQLILEFGSITFLLVSLLMSIANFKMRKQTQASTTITLFSILGLSVGTILIFYYEWASNLEQLLFITLLYIVLTLGAWGYAHVKKTQFK